MRGLRLFYPKAYCYITGSDQVWAMPLSNPKEAWHYLDFGRAKTRRISYAASFGHNEFPEEDRKMFVNYIKKFDKISVREESGLRICNSMGFDANRCVDSTLLLDKNEYVNIMSSRKHFSPYAFIYSVNMTSSSDIFWGEIKDDIQKLGLNTIVTTASGYAPARELFGNVNYDYVTPNEWLSNIYYSEIILTSSFHGVVFSLIFKKNFVYFPLSNSYKTGNDRITDLLKLVNLGNRTATDGQSAISLLNSNIDYSSLDFSQLNNLIKSSKDFITL